MAGPESDDRDGVPPTARLISNTDFTVPDPVVADRVDPRLSRLPARFKIGRTLGQGGMGLVVEAFDRVLDRDVAIKVLSADRANPTLAERFLREARVAARLQHPGIVKVHDVHPEDEYIVMELVHGESLSARLERDGRLPAVEVIRIGKALLEALGHAHDAGIVHRDVKPANVLLSESDEVKLVDFGIAMVSDSELTTPGTVIGTPAYMAPEQLRGLETDARADVYAAGATLFKAATGTRLHDSRDVERAVLDATGNQALAAAIARAVHERPEDRFADGRAFAIALETEPAALPPALMVVNIAAPRAASRWRAPLVGAVVMLALIAGGYAVHRRATAADAPPTLALKRVVALLPFVDTTGQPTLDFVQEGLPGLLANEMRGAPNISTIGYYRMESNVNAGAPLADWIAAAGRLGADVIVRGELAPVGDLVRIAIFVETVGGERIALIERHVRAREVTDVVRGTASKVVHAVIGRHFDTGGKVTSTFAADRALQRGIAALERERIPEAIEQLETAVREAPELAIAHYYLALAYYWRARPLDRARAQIEKALSLALAEQQRGVLQALRRLVDQDYVGGVSVLRPLAERYPEEKDVLYVLFEALFHGGFPAEAMVVYRQITALHPRFRLALVHSFDFYLAHGDETGMSWALSQSSPGGDAYDTMWEPRVLVARREYDAAIRMLAAALERATDPDAVRQLEEELVSVYALADRPELARAYARKRFDADPSSNAHGLLVLANARGDAEDRSRLRDLAVRYAATRPAGPVRINRWLFLINGEFAVDSKAQLAELGTRLRESLVSDMSRTLWLAVTRVLLAEAAGDVEQLRELATSAYPEVSELAAAALARRANDRNAAAQAMRRAIARSPDGRFIINEWWLLAGDLRALGDHDGVRAACDEVIRPRRWSWAWGSTVGDCLAWSADASEALGQANDARAAWQRLARLRVAAAKGDRLADAARAGLARLNVQPEAPARE